jgi:hypothetical protein
MKVQVESSPDGISLPTFDTPYQLGRPGHRVLRGAASRSPISTTRPCLYVPPLLYWGYKFRRTPRLPDPRRRCESRPVSAAGVSAIVGG